MHQSTFCPAETPSRQRASAFGRAYNLIRRATTISLICFIAAHAPADSAINLAAETPRAPKPLCGRLSEIQGLPVLELWGSPEQAAYAHGFLLAKPMQRLFEDFLLSPKILPNPAMYKMMLVPGVRRQFVWSDEYLRELEALIEGMRARLNEDELVCPKLGRPLQIEDLMVGNTLADWFGAMCASFTVWGDLSADGRTLTARNLDFPSTSIMERLQIVVIRRPHGDAPGWVGVSWPGLIGVYTAMNDRGVTMMMHDARGLPATEGAGFTPRSLILREALEAARPASFVEDVLKVFRQRIVLVGNNIHVSAPMTPGLPPAAIFEYDANAEGQGVTVRTPAASGTATVNGLWCTNHMRLRKPPQDCWRYARLNETLTQLTEKHEQITPADSLELIVSVRQSITLHSVCFIPDQKKILVSIPAVSSAVAEFDLKHWLNRPVGVSVDDVGDRKDQP